MKNNIYFDKLEYVEENRKYLIETIHAESTTIGYYQLPNQNIDEIVAYADSFDVSVEDIVVLGIGGSSLGAKAIYEFLKPVKKFTRRLFFFESTDPINIVNQLEEINLEKSHVLVISKSGGTVETISMFKYLFAANADKSRYTFITDEGSNLDKFAEDLGSKRFYLPPNVGGRFSVLSVVGLIPLALCGVDIKAILTGAKGVSDAFFNEGELRESLLDKALFYAHNHQRYAINCLFAYSETLKYFTEWYVQLWGESLGKKQRHSAFNVGLTPIGLIGPKDQHSFLQLIMEGTRDKSVTFIKVHEFASQLTIPAVTLKHLESLDMLNEVPFHDLITMQCDSVMQALKNEKEIPLDEIIIPYVNASSIGALMFYYELLTSMVGELLDVNTYDQPGVEAGKIILKEKLKSLR